MQTLQKVGIFVRMRNTGSEQLPIKPADKIARNSVSVSAEVAFKRLLKTGHEREDLLLRFNDYKARKEYLERNFSEQEVTVEVVKASRNQLRTKVNVLQNQNRLPQNTNETLMKRYSEQKAVVGNTLK